MEVLGPSDKPISASDYNRYKAKLRPESHCSVEEPHAGDLSLPEAAEDKGHGMSGCLKTHVQVRTGLITACHHISEGLVNQGGSLFPSIFEE